MAPRKKTTAAADTAAAVVTEAAAEKKTAKKTSTAKKNVTKAAETKAAETKAVETKAVETKAAEPKTTAKKTAKKAAPKAEVFIEYGGAQVAVDEMIANAKAIVGDDKDIKIYVQPENSKAYIAFGDESVAMDVYFCK